MDGNYSTHVFSFFSQLLPYFVLCVTRTHIINTTGERLFERSHCFAHFIVYLPPICSSQAVCGSKLFCWAKYVALCDLAYLKQSLQHSSVIVYFNFEKRQVYLDNSLCGLVYITSVDLTPPVLCHIVHREEEIPDALPKATLYLERQTAHSFFFPLNFLWCGSQFSNELFPNSPHSFPLKS